MNRVRSLLSMRSMLPGYSFNPRPNNSSLGTADSVMDIGLSINGYYIMIDKFILLCKFYIKTVHINTLFTLTRRNLSLIKELSFWKRSIFFLRDEACLESIKGRQSISVLWLKNKGKIVTQKHRNMIWYFLLLWDHDFRHTRGTPLCTGSPTSSAGFSRFPIWRHFANREGPGDEVAGGLMIFNCLLAILPAHEGLF